MCSGLQAQILRCYRDHLQEVLLCSDLVKAYQHCVNTARKVRPHPAGAPPPCPHGLWAPPSRGQHLVKEVHVCPLFTLGLLGVGAG